MSQRRIAIRLGLFSLALGLMVATPVVAQEPTRTLDVWTGSPPGERALSTGETMPQRPTENPLATRVAKITQPTLDVFEPSADKRNGAAVLILPGGGYNYVVVDKEGAEAARWLNGLGVTGFVLRYRTKGGTNEPLWKRPVQDAQRAISLVRAHAADWHVDPERIGIVGFSAGGQAAAIAATAFNHRSYEPTDVTDKTSCRPDFALLVYPWQIWDEKQNALIAPLTVTGQTPPTFLVHAHDDSASSLSSVYLYAALKQNKVPAELHVFQNGGHGYGLRPVAGSNINTWPSRAEDWLRQRGVLK